MNFSDLQKKSKSQQGADSQNEQKTEPPQIQAQTQPTELILPLETVKDQPQVSQSQTEVKYAGFWIRYCAHFVDGIIVLVLGMIFGFAVGFLFAVSGINGRLLISLSGILGTLVGWAYYIYMTYNYEATFGKQFLGLKVIPTNGGELELGQVVLRETVGKIISGIILGIGYFMIGFDSRKQGLHDKIGSTLVVYSDPTKSSSKKIIIIVIFMVIIGLLVSFCIYCGITFTIADARGRISGLNKYVKSTVMNSATLGATCLSEGGMIVEPESPLGGGAVCSSDSEDVWPILTNGFRYGRISQEEISIVSEDGQVYTCSFDGSWCNFLLPTPIDLTE